MASMARSGQSNLGKTISGIVSGLLLFVLIRFLLGNLIATHMRNWQGELRESKAKLNLCQMPYDRFVVLTRAQKNAFECGQYELARSYASELLRLAPDFQSDWNYGNAIHDGHVVLGRIALIHGLRKEACQELLLAGKTPGSPTLSSFGPNMALARDLLKDGQIDTVCAYFAECDRFWHSGHRTLSRWKFLARCHVMPDFGTNLIY
jgi:hypothetical protein